MVSKQCYISFVYRLNLLGSTDIQVQSFLVEILLKHLVTLTPNVTETKHCRKWRKSISRLRKILYQTCLRNNEKCWKIILLLDKLIELMNSNGNEMKLMENVGTF